MKTISPVKSERVGRALDVVDDAVDYAATKFGTHSFEYRMVFRQRLSEAKARAKRFVKRGR
jgi:hypothetical protein